MDLKLCTSNEGKRREFERILGISLSLAALELDEIQSVDTEAVCRAKAELAFAKVGTPILVDDTGFELIELGAFPGALVTWAIAEGDLGILHRMLPPDAVGLAAAVTCIGLADETGVRVFTGRVAGRVLRTPRGSGGFGFDPVFVPDGETRSFAELSDEEKDDRSPRGLALAKLAKYLAERG